ncbi:MAG: type II toxin-antitoxin system VapC family toxin [Planctomycetes bacterium]|nr:type II toxin-antitoxin system VapC family toxin [Planctomycetota bacterium]
MILLDTDHLTVFKYPEHERYAALASRLGASSDQDIGTTVISLEEQFRGWMALISRVRNVERQTGAYPELVNLFDFFARLTLLPFDGRAAAEFGRLRSAGVRIGSMDLKIASIALVHDAVLLTSNRKDFEKVPGLRFENWLS